LRHALIDWLQLKVSDFVAASMVEWRHTYGAKGDRQEFIDEIRPVIHAKVDEAIDDVFAEDADGHR